MDLKTGLYNFEIEGTIYKSCKWQMHIQYFLGVMALIITPWLNCLKLQ